MHYIITPHTGREHAFPSRKPVLRSLNIPHGIFLRMQLFASKFLISTYTDGKFQMFLSFYYLTYLKILKLKSSNVFQFLLLTTNA